MENIAEKRLEEFLKASPEASQKEIREFKELVEKYFTGEIPADKFKASRLHMGTYGIRAAEGVHMMRIKISQGRLNAEQLECLAGLAEDYSKGIGHITTRQCMQLYWVPTKEVPLVMARVAAVGLTSREACGNSVRAVTADPHAGVSPTELFDVTEHSWAVTQHFLRNPASQTLPRKFKITFEGSPEDRARTAIHDIGAVAAIRETNGKKELGFKLYMGGGLGAVPVSAVLLEEFTPVDELIRTCEAAVRVHDRLGDRKNKATARLKFVLKRLGADAFRKEIFAEREKLPITTYEARDVTETKEKPPEVQDVTVIPAPQDETYQQWFKTNVIAQKQDNYSMVAIRLGLGDITVEQMRTLAKIMRRYNGGMLRTSIRQNLILRWVRNDLLPALYAELKAIDLVEPNAFTIYDVTSCPGASTCQLGIAASRGLATAIEKELAEAGLTGRDLEDLQIKISGCPNSCGQHHIADVGFFGGARKVNGRLAPHFQLMIGGYTEEGKAEFGKNVTKLPAWRTPAAMIEILKLYRKDRTSESETFRAFAERVGTAYWKEALKGFENLPTYEEQPEAYRDWFVEKEFSLEGMGPGECAA